MTRASLTKMPFVLPRATMMSSSPSCLIYALPVQPGNTNVVKLEATAAPAADREWLVLRSRGDESARVVPVTR